MEVEAWSNVEKEQPDLGIAMSRSFLWIEEGFSLNHFRRTLAYSLQRMVFLRSDGVRSSCHWLATRPEIRRHGWPPRHEQKEWWILIGRPARSMRAALRGEDVVIEVHHSSRVW